MATGNCLDRRAAFWRALAVWGPAGMLCAAGIAGLGAASLLAATPGAGDAGRWLVVAAPGTRLATMVNIVAAADGRLVQPGRLSNIVIAASARPDFPAALSRAGAWIAIPAPALGGCLDPLVQDPT
jgi:hypothetical protein